MGKNNQAVEFHDVSPAFDGRPALDRVSFMVCCGESEVIMGGSIGDEARGARRSVSGCRSSKFPP